MSNGDFPRPRDMGSPDQLPPQNLEAEQGVLGSILLDPSILPGIRRIVGSHDFYLDVHILYFRRLAEMADEEIPIDAITVSERLARLGEFEKAGGDETLSTLLAAVPNAANATYYAHIVREKSQLRNLIDAACDTLREAYSNKHTFDQVADRHWRRLESVAGLSRHPRPDEFREPNPWPAPLGEAAYHGIVGDAIRMIEPHTEADPAALLVQFLVAAGNVFGRKPHWLLGGTRHGLNLFACIVGDSANARKGTSWDAIWHIFQRVDPDWARKRIGDGLSSGEGLIMAVRDEVLDKRQQQLFEEVKDKRFLAIESEFGGTLANAGREGNNLSAKLRTAWDGKDLSAINKLVIKASNPHISVIGHITTEELARRLCYTDSANGFANRFMWVCSRRSRFLPHGGTIPRHDLNFIVEHLEKTLDWCQANIQDIRLDFDARPIWEAQYGRLTTPPPGMIGIVISRAAPIVMRLACLYAILDGDLMIRACHMNAALEVWRYCEESARHVFGDRLGDPEAERLLEAIQEAGEEGLSRRAIVAEVFQRNKSKGEIDGLLGKLQRNGFIVRRKVPTPGRPAEVWFLEALAPPEPKPES